VLAVTNTFRSVMLTDARGGWKCRQELLTGSPAHERCDIRQPLAQIPYHMLQRADRGVGIALAFRHRSRLR
jgi:hypothetical protein